MKNQGKTFLSIVMIITVLLIGAKTTLGQSEILSVNPPSAFQGETVHLIIQGSGTNFAQDKTEVIFPENPDIAIKSTLVNNPELITVQIQIKDNASAGPVVIEIETQGQQTITVKNEFEITGLAGNPEAMITIYPVQTVYLSDFDFSNLRNLPLLFTISVYSSGQQYIKVVTELVHYDYGFVASAEKVLEIEGSLGIYTFNNREFDSYDIDKASDEIIESATGNGTIPPGQYIYTVSLIGKDGSLLCDPVISEFYISGMVSGIDMIAPGMPLDTDPELIITNTPYFQWFGSLPEYSFTLYEVLEGQTSADDIVSNIPVFQVNALTSASYLYPNFAENLIEGKTYAWQITSSILASSGEQEISSDVYWFVFQNISKSVRSIDKIEISPDDIDLMPGDSVQIKVDGFDINGESMKVECEWQTIPEGMGRVNDNGWFVAGKKTGTVAISAKCGFKEDYITLNIVGKSEDKEESFKQEN